MPTPNLCAVCEGMGSNRRRKMQDDGAVLVDWYENRPEATTHYKDEKIAAELRWFPKNARFGYGEAGRVRNVRRHIDRCKCLFDGYAFGTKRNGAGQRTSRLHRRGQEANADALALQLGEQIGRVLQGHDQHGAERERAITLLMEHRDTYTKAGDFERAFCVDHCIRDIEQFNTIQPSTVHEAQKLGVPVPRLI